MKPLFSVLAILAFLFVTASTARVTAQDDAVDVSAYVERAQRLREFGYPILARRQLDEARKQNPIDRALLLEYMRLYNSYQQATTEEMKRYVEALKSLYPDDYEACLEIAWWLYYVEPPEQPPMFKDEADLKRILERLDAEMVVYRELAAYVLKPEGKLPGSAEGSPALPLAFLARCARARPGTADVLFFAARDLERRAVDFDQWARTADELREPFRLAAQEIYGLLLPLYREASKDGNYNVGAKVNIAQTYYRMGKYKEAHTACVAAEVQAPNNLTIAETRLAIAEKLQDFGLLTDALTRLHTVYDDVSSELDLLAVKRMVLNEWSFETWLAWREIALVTPGRFDDREMIIQQRAGLIRELLKTRPTFLELYFLDARNAMELAGLPETEGEQRRNLYNFVLKTLEQCEQLGADFADWHALQAAAHWELGQFEQAAAAYDRLAQLDDKDVEARKHAIAAREIAEGKFTARDYEAYREQLEGGDLRTKLKVLKEVTRRSPKFFAAQLVLGKVAFMLKDFQGAYTAYGAGHKLEPENLECLDGLAHAAMYTERYAESLEFFVKLNAVQHNYQGADRWEGILRWVTDGEDARRSAFRKWLESSEAQLEQRARINLLEQAVLLEPAFAEALVDLAAMRRGRDNRLAENYVNQAIRHARDDYTRAAAHRERGRLRLSMSQHAAAVTDFEAAYTYRKDDGSDLLLAALAHHALGRQAEASAAMRRLFAEVPDTMLLRPPLRDVGMLDLAPVQSEGVLEVHPAYDTGDVARFRARIEVSGEGGAQLERDLALEYDLRVEVLDKPVHGGIWRVNVKVENAPEAFSQLNGVSLNLRISPWFGLLDEPELGGNAEVLNPALQALTEGLTVGIGDAPIPRPYIWKTDLTMGPPHLGGDSAEAGALVEKIGDTLSVQRRALAGRQLGQGEDQHGSSKAIEARVTVGGSKRALRDVEFQILIKTLTPDKDDVAKSRLYVKLAAK